jgi:hypothetical protein
MINRHYAGRLLGEKLDGNCVMCADKGYFALRLNRLKSPEEWTPKRQGLSFLFPKGGVGYYVSGPVAERLSTGDVLVFSGRQAGRMKVLEWGAPVGALSGAARKRSKTC